jgi:hypothetical protein
MHMFVSLIRLGKQDVLETAHTFNMETMQPEPAEAASHQAEQAALLVPLLGLCEQQQELIAVGLRLYYDLVLEVHTERQSLQVKVAAAALSSARDATMQRSTSSEADCSNGRVRNAAACSSDGRLSNAAACSSSGGSSSSSAGDTASGLISRLESLEQQSEVTDRLQLLLHKVSAQASSIQQAQAVAREAAGWWLVCTDCVMWSGSMQLL